MKSSFLSQRVTNVWQHWIEELPMLCHYLIWSVACASVLSSHIRLTFIIMLRNCIKSQTILALLAVTQHLSDKKSISRHWLKYVMSIILTAKCVTRIKTGFLLSNLYRISHTMGQMVTQYAFRHFHDLERWQRLHIRLLFLHHE